MEALISNQELFEIEKHTALMLAKEKLADPNKHTKKKRIMRHSKSLEAGGNVNQQTLIDYIFLKPKEIKRYISDEVLSRLSVTRCG